MPIDLAKRSELGVLLAQLAAGEVTPHAVVERVLGRANSNAGRNVFIALDAEKALREAEGLPLRFPGTEKPALYGLPVSLKDLFDLQGFPTSCGAKFYAERGGLASADSAVAVRLREQGAVIIGKTHLHQLAYGITGENPDYGDCVQPGAPQWLTGGSSSGAAASVMEGSALAAIGTDTGGSIRVPAALCGLAGYRASIELARERGLWRGGVPLAGSFDTLGWLFRDLRDGPFLARALFDLEVPEFNETRVRIGCVTEEFIQDSEPNVRGGFAGWQSRLRDRGAEIIQLDTNFWAEAPDIYAPIVAHEAAAYHGMRTRNDFSHFHPAIADRLKWGLSIPDEEIAQLDLRLAAFCQSMEELFRECDFVIAPCAPISRLLAGMDHNESRKMILRYTTPMSLAGVPVVTLPARGGAAVQLIGTPGDDARLLAFAAGLAGGESRVPRGGAQSS